MGWEGSGVGGMGWVGRRRRQGTGDRHRDRDRQTATERQRQTEQPVREENPENSDFLWQGTRSAQDRALVPDLGKSDFSRDVVSETNGLETRAVREARARNLFYIKRKGLASRSDRIFIVILAQNPVLAAAGWLAGWLAAAAG